MGYVIGVIVIVVGVLVSIGLHEVGHMLPAKKFGVKVPQYMIGFGPTLWSKVKGDTEYGIKAIPLGGYVRMIGMLPPGKYRNAEGVAQAEAARAAGEDPDGKRGWWREIADGAREASAAEIGPGDEDRAFYKLSVPKKLTVMFGGPCMNLVIAIVLMGVVFCGIGTVQTTTTIGSVAACVDANADGTCPAGAQPSPAKAAGLQAGDTIVSIDGQSIDSWDQAASTIAAHPGEPEQFVVSRDGELVSLEITPAVKETGSGAVGAIGIVSQTATVRTPISQLPNDLWMYLSSTFEGLAQLPASVVQSAQSLFTGQQRGAESGVSVVGVAQVAGQIGAMTSDSTSQQVAAWLMLIALLNVSLFVFNMIPLLPLDGGHIAGALWEGIRRTWARIRQRRILPGAVDLAMTMPMAYVVFGLFFLMGGIMILADIVNPIQFG